MKRLILRAAPLCALIFSLSNCGGNEPVLVANQPATANANSQAGSPSRGASPAQPAKPASASSGDYIDTSESDAKIKRLEEQAQNKPNDQGVRKQLAQAYLERGNALTQARQYRAALGDYRRTLKLDPDNEEAQRWSKEIIGILQQMNREVPAEGTEPTPLKQ